MSDFSTKSQLHTCQTKPILRSWHSTQSIIQKSQLIFPVFICENDDAEEEIPSLPGQKRVGINNLKSYLESSVKNGLSCVLLFGVIEDKNKTPSAAFASHPESPVMKAIPKVKSLFPNILIACDVCLCAYTTHGHCGILDSHSNLDTRASCTRLAEISLAYSKAGADIIAPSDMMDNRIAYIKRLLVENGFNRVNIMSYSAKFASSFYGPFRDAAKSAPSAGDRKGYQLPPGAKGLAMRAVERDVHEGADILMVKPGLPYLDVIQAINQKYPDYTLAVYHVSGEYAMLHHAAKAGAIDLESASMELLTSFRRAGASVIITYLTPYLLTLDFEKFRF